MPTPQEIVVEIESGPLKDVLVPHWSLVFPHEQEPEDKKSQAWARWNRIKDRFGTLTPDGAFEVAAILNDPLLWQRVEYTLSRGSFLSILAPLAIQLISKDADTRQKWSVLLNLATGGDEDVNIGRPEIQALFDVALVDGLLTDAQRETYRTAGTTPCSRTEALGWGYVSADLIRAAKGAV